jgi:hypothetical protein
MFINYNSNNIQGNIYFANSLPNNYKTNRDLGKDVIKKRNVLIVLTVMEIFTSIWGFSYFFVRRVR